LTSPVHVKVAAESQAADTVQQSLYFIDSQGKMPLLEELLKGPVITRALVFTRTKHGADKVVRKLCTAGIAAEAIHSNKSQNARMRALHNFKTGQTRVLVASDIAARGLDVDNISHVINYDLPNEAETYIHRIGRTGRAGASGQAISFCCQEQRDDLREIERLLGRAIPVLQHSIKMVEPAFHDDRQFAGQSQRRGSSSRSHSTHTSHKTATPQQQKDDFWRSKRKPTSQGWGQSKIKRRGK
jgi:ATP-dependent RNA helicase RhlE